LAKKINGETVEMEPRSREGQVWITANWVYKTCGSRNAHDVVESYQQARAAGVPVPDVCVTRIDVEDGAASASHSVIRMTRLSGRFFQFSKGGGERVLETELAAVDNSLLAQSALAGLEAACALGVTDPQGFVNRSSNPPVMFIDLHFTGAPRPVAFESVIGAARVQLARLRERFKETS